jgi:hypothetical protein
MFFRHGKRNRKSLLIERKDIITWRRRYLRGIKKKYAKKGDQFLI